MNKENFELVPASRVLKTTPKLGDSQRRITELNVESYSQLSLVPAKGHKTKQAKKKIHGVKLKKIRYKASKSLLPVE